MLSRSHPTADWLRHGGSYYHVRVVSETWRKGWNVRCWLTSLEVTCAEFAAAGFVIERLTEPRPVPDGARAQPEGHYERLRREPGFIAFRLRPWGGT